MPTLDESMSEDLISRDAVLDACSQSINILDAMSRIEDLPSVTPIPCEDVISRQAAISDIQEMAEWHTEDAFNADRVIQHLKDLPSVNPKQMVGRWIDEGYYADGSNASTYRCSVCGGHIIEYEPDRYCKFCGAKMEEQE